MQASHLISGQLASLELKGELADRLCTGLPAWLAQTVEVGVCQSFLAGGALNRVKGQHALQQAQSAPVRLHKVLLEVYPRLLAHVHQEPACLLIAHLCGQASCRVRSPQQSDCQSTEPLVALIARYCTAFPDL